MKHSVTNATPSPDSAATQYVSSVSLGDVMVSGKVTCSTYSQKLIEDAEKQTAAGEHGLAVILAAMACEVAVNISFTQSFEDQGVQHLEKVVRDFINGYSLSSDKKRKLFETMTGKDLASKPWWGKYKQTTKKRNDIVHEGARATADEAKSAIAAATDMAKELGQWFPQSN